MRTTMPVILFKSMLSPSIWLSFSLTDIGSKSRGQSSDEGPSLTRLHYC